jgi:hypothetical protein
VLSVDICDVDSDNPIIFFFVAPWLFYGACEHTGSRYPWRQHAAEGIPILNRSLAFPVAVPHFRTQFL